MHGPSHGRHGGHDHGHHHGSHDHSHDHAGGHSHDLKEAGRKRLLIVLAMTGVFMVVELVGGILSNSLALIADAGHMLSDVGALALSVFALWFARRPATAEKTYGYLRTEILAALVNGATLLVISGLILWHAWERVREPQAVEGGLMLSVAAAGLLVNIIAAFLLHASSGHSLNIRGAYLHVLGDLLGSVGAIAAALLILFTDWTLADPLISALVALLIVVGAWRLVRESVDVLLEAVPRHIDMNRVRQALLDIPGVEEVHDLHVWTLTSGYLAMSGHTVITDPAKHQETIGAVHEAMHDLFGISHVTVQVEHRTIVPIRHNRRSTDTE